MINNKRNAFTLVELLIALSITVLIGGTVITMITSVAQGTSATQNGRNHFVRSQMLENRLREVIERSRCVLAVSSTAIVLWFDEIPGKDFSSTDGGNPTTPPTNLEDRFLVNRNEIILVEWDAASRQVRMYYSDTTPIETLAAQTVSPVGAYPANWNSATYMAEAQKIKGQSTGLSRMTVIGTEVNSFAISAFPASEPLSNATIINATATVGSGLDIRTVVVGAMMRQRMAPK